MCCSGFSSWVSNGGVLVLIKLQVVCRYHAGLFSCANISVFYVCVLFIYVCRFCSAVQVVMGRPKAYRTCRLVEICSSIDHTTRLPR